MNAERLSVDRCRSLLPEGSSALPDEQVLKLRDGLYEFAEMAADAYLDSTTDWDAVPQNARVISELLARILEETDTAE